MTRNTMTNSHLRPVRPDGDAHLVAQGPQDVVGAQHREEICKRPQHARDLGAFDLRRCAQARAEGSGLSAMDGRMIAVNAFPCALVVSRMLAAARYAIAQVPRKAAPPACVPDPVLLQGREGRWRWPWAMMGLLLTALLFVLLSSLAGQPAEDVVVQPQLAARRLPARCLSLRSRRDRSPISTC